MNLPDWLHWLDHCPSTNTWAMTHRDTLTHGSVVFTRRQTAGRGQHGRFWYAPPGVLTASFLLMLPPYQLSGLSLLAGLAVIQAIEELLPDYRGCFGLKWPNDLVIAEQKVAGILCEAASRADLAQATVVVGVGLNHRVDFAQTGFNLGLTGPAISLYQLSAWVPEELALLERLRYYLMQMAATLGQSTGLGVHRYWTQLSDRDILRNRPLTLATPTETLSGIGAGLDRSGRLCLQLADGCCRAFSTGHLLEWRLTSDSLVAHPPQLAAPESINLHTPRSGSK